MRHLSSGFTAIEMMVTVGIMAILLAIAAPSYNTTISSTRMSGEINSLQGALNLARSEAVKRGLRVDVCPQNGAICGTGVTDWSSGWYVVVDNTLGNTPPTYIKVLNLSTHTPSDTLTSTLTTYPYFTPAGYTYYANAGPAYITLRSTPDVPGLRRCIFFNAGSYTTKVGSSCQ